MITITHRVTPPISPDMHRPHARAPHAAANGQPDSEGTQSAVRVLRLCNSRLAHIAFEPIPWRRK